MNAACGRCAPDKTVGGGAKYVVAGGEPIAVSSWPDVQTSRVYWRATASQKEKGLMLTASSILGFKSRFAGEVLAPGDTGYDAARMVFNATIDRRPAVIVRCTNADDVAEAVNFGREQNLVIAVRAAGHNVAGYAVCDDGIVIDLSRMKAIDVDPVRRTVRAGAGLTWGELNDELQKHGLAATGGFVSTTGVSGLTLGGGLGWLVRKHGLALDNLLSAEVVLADGRQVTASERDNDDLFWAIRGASVSSRPSNSGCIPSGSCWPESSSILPRRQPARSVAGATSRPALRKNRPKARCCFIFLTIRTGRRHYAARRSAG
jgi:hypothetical protein